METFSTRQASVIASANKTIYWLFRVQDASGNIFYWSTGTVPSSGNETVVANFLDAPSVYPRSEWERAHSFAITNFAGITLRRGKSEAGIQAPNDISFTILNDGNALDANDFIGGVVRVGLVVSDGTSRELCGSWRFRIKSASPYNQQIDVSCEDFLQEFLKGTYPNTRAVSAMYPSTDGTPEDTLCIPEPYGTCYIPLRSVYAGGDRYYVLGDPNYSYTISEVRSPREMGAKTTWSSGSYTFAQSNVEGWRMFQPMIANGQNGVFMSGSKILDIPTKFSRSDTASVTNPADVLRRVLRNMGVKDYDLNLASFDVAKATFTSWGLAWNFAFWYRQERAEVLAILLAMCHASLVVGEQVSLNVLSKTSRATITDAEVIKTQEAGLDTFKYSATSLDRVSDSGNVGYQVTGEAQDEFITALVPAKSTTITIDAETIVFPGVQDTQHVQKLGTLYYQRKFLKSASVNFTTKGTCLALRPDDVVTISHADYGGTYAVLVEEVSVKPDLSLDFSCVKFAFALDDWGDLNPGAIVPNTNTPTGAYNVVVAGPDTTSSSGGTPNELSGRLRIGSGQDFVIIDPSDPLRISMFDDNIEKFRIGNLKGFLDYPGAVDVYGMAFGDSAKFLKYDPTTGIKLGGSGVARIELDMELARISVKDATNATKTAMGYLNGLAKNDGTGNWGAGDYGFWAAQGDRLRIDGDTTYESGDWIVENDGAYLIQNAAGQTIIRLGTVNGIKGLFMYDNSTPTQNLLAKFGTDEVYIGDGAHYLQYTPAGGLIIRGTLNASDITAGSIDGSRITAGTITGTQISASYIYAGELNADLITLGTLSTERIATGSIDATHISPGYVYTGTLTAAQVNAVAISASSITTGTLSAARIAAGSITGTHISGTYVYAGTLTAAQVNAVAINASSITAGTLSVDRIQTGSINGIKIADLAIGTNHLASLSVTDAKINSLSATKITAGTLAAGVIYAGTLSANNITAGTLSGSVVYAGTINASNINAGTLNVGVTMSANQITAGTISGSVVYAGTINASNINAGTLNVGVVLNASQITAGTLNVDRIQAGSINGLKIANGAITGGSGGHIAAGTITGTNISAGTITSTHISGAYVYAGTLTAAQVNAVAISATSITTGSMQGGRIAAGTITATQISSAYVYAGTISADNINVGTLNVDRVATNSINGVKIGTGSNGVGTTNLVSYAATVSGGATGSASASVYVTCYGGTQVTVSASGYVACASTGYMAGYLRAYRDGALIGESLGLILGQSPGSYMPLSLVVVDSPSSGGHTYSVQVVTGNATAQWCAITVLESRR